jgi:hypothetical protein
MKIYINFLVLVLLHRYLVTAFFVPQTRKTSGELHSSSSDNLLENLNEFNSVNQEQVLSDLPQERTGAPLELYNPSRNAQHDRNSAAPMSHSLPARTRTVQGGSRGTVYDPYNERAQEVSIQTDGRPLAATFELWEGPNNTPQKMKVYSEDGRMRPFTSVVEKPRPGGSAMDIRNTGPMEFPLTAAVGAGTSTKLSSDSVSSADFSLGTTIQGGALFTFPFGPSVRSVQVSIRTDGMPLMAIVEIWQGPGSVRQIAKIYTDNGLNRPFAAVIETPGYGSTIAIRNVGPMEFPLTASVVPYRTESSPTAIQTPWYE